MGLRNEAIDGALGQPSPASAPASQRSGFAELDAALSSIATADSKTEPRTVIARGPRAVLEHLSAHAVRRLASSAKSVGRVARIPVASGMRVHDPWVEIARYVAPDGSVAALTPTDVASRIATSLSSGVEAIIVVDAALSRFGAAVVARLSELSGSSEAKLFVLVASDDPRESHVANLEADAARIIEIDSRMQPADVDTWWQLAAAELSPSADRLDLLAGWWRAARATAADAEAPAPDLSPGARQLHGRLELAGRAWPLASLQSLGAREQHAKELRALRLVEIEGDLVRLSDTRAASGPTSPAEARVVVDALDAVFEGDSWATMRAAELLSSTIEAGDAEAEAGGAGAAAAEARVEALATRAIRGVIDAETREDLWRRYCVLLGEADDPSAASRCRRLVPNPGRLLRTADLAVRIGDFDRASELARRAAVLGGDSPKVLLTLGRATAAIGDLTTARFTIEKAMARSEPGSLDWARASIELAEVSYANGDLVAAETLAKDAERIALASDIEGESTRLDARNVLGKLLLARAAYNEAVAHFAADACDAACASLSEAELRATLNRAIALFSLGRYDEARAMQENVLHLGERRGEIKAVCFALGNLAVIAIYMHRYAEALGLLERSIDIVRRAGHRPSLALYVIDLAELRLRLGLDVEAEQLLGFGRKMCMGSTHRLGHFSLVSARIQLARGNTAAATRDAAAAMTANGISMVQASAGGAHWAGVQGDQALECLRVAARVALAEGDVRHARELVARAASEQGTSRAKAELVILRACTARASGEPFRALAEQALSAARETDDEEFMREAHLLVVGAAQLEGDDASVKLHVDAAIQLREQVVSGLPDAIRLRYLARRDLQELARLERTLPKEASSPPASSASGVALLRAPRRSGDRRIIGDDAAIRALLVAVNKVGRSDATVLIHGESGTGKELVAEALHAASARATGPLVKLNCAALVETLLLSELFGHEKGAFTGASSRRRGRFESADGGTLFLDEIGDISPRTQVALLRVLQEKTFERVGGAASIRADVRVVCATHRDLKALVASGAFREDLYYRLCGVTLQVPALRQRPGDLGALAAALLERIAVERGERVKRLADSALRGLRTHSWPGNVRELENALRAASLFSESDELVLEDFCEHVDSLRHLADDARSRSAPHLVPPPAPTPPPTQRSVDEAASASPVEVAYAHVRGGVSLGDLKKQIERDCISRALHETDGNITRAAVLLGMKRPRLSQLVKQLGLAADGENGWPETDATELCEED